MIILITGATHTGKTRLAQKLMEQYRIPYFSIDHLKMGLIRSGLTSLTPEDDDKLTAYLWPIVREMVKTAIENGQSLIAEGCYIPADWRKDFDKRYLPEIRMICLVMTKRYIDVHFDDIRRHASDIEKRQDDAYCTVTAIQNDNRAVAQAFADAGETLSWIDGDYEAVIHALLSDPL